MFKIMNYTQALSSFTMQVLQSNGASILVADMKNKAHFMVPEHEAECTFGPPPADGYMVSLKNGMVVNLSEVRRNRDIEGIKSIFNELVQRCNELHIRFPEIKGNLYIGAWVDEAKVLDEREQAFFPDGYLVGDISINVNQLHVAVALGRANEQRAIYDVKNEKSIYI